MMMMTSSVKVRLCSVIDSRWNGKLFDIEIQANGQCFIQDGKDDEWNWIYHRNVSIDHYESKTPLKC